MTPIENVEILGFQRWFDGFAVHYRVAGYPYLDGWRAPEDRDDVLPYGGRDYHSHHLKNCPDELQAMSRFIESWKNKEVYYA